MLDQNELFNTEKVEALRKKYLGKKIRVSLFDPYQPLENVEGIVELVDDAGQLHGTWSGLAAIPELDYIEIIG